MPARLLSELGLAGRAIEWRTLARVYAGQGEAGEIATLHGRPRPRADAPSVSNCADAGIRRDLYAAQRLGRLELMLDPRTPSRTRRETPRRSRQPRRAGWRQRCRPADRHQRRRRGIDAEAFGEAFADSSAFMGGAPTSRQRRRLVAARRPAPRPRAGRQDAGTAADCAHLVREAMITAGLEHPGISSSVYDGGEPRPCRGCRRCASCAALARLALDDARASRERMRLVRRVAAAEACRLRARARHRASRPETSQRRDQRLRQTQVIGFRLTASRSRREL
ncbi:MAG: hypothetical protein U1F43_24975 [Myxococcota bacterium]